MLFGKKKKVQKKPRKKKKLTCCQRCRRKICKWIYRRCKRCFKKHIFGVPDPKLEEYDFAGVNLGEMRDKFKTKSSKSEKSTTKSKKDIPENKNSVQTLYRNKKKSTLSIPFKEKLLSEFDKLSLKKPNVDKLKSYIDDFRERNLYIGLSKESLLNLNKSEKEYYKKKAEEYEYKYNYNKYNSNSYVDLQELQALNKSELKKKLSINSSKHDIVKTILSDYKKNKFSLTGLLSKSKVDINKLDKKTLHKILQGYKEKKEHYPFVKQSKIKQFKSDLRAKMAQLDY